MLLSQAVAIALGLTIIDVTNVGIARGSLAGFAAAPDASITMAVIWADTDGIQNKSNRSEQPTQNAQSAGLRSDGRFDQPTQKA